MRRRALSHHYNHFRLLLSSSSSSSSPTKTLQRGSYKKHGLLFRTSHFLQFTTRPTPITSSISSLRGFNTKSSTTLNQFQDETIEEEAVYDWEEEDDEAEAVIGDGGDGGGVVLGGVSWGEQALSIARDIILQFGDDMEIFAFKISPRGYIYVRLDKLSNKYGCPSMEEMENFSALYKKRLNEVGESGDIPSDLALEVSSPGAERLLKVPNDLERFKEMPMQVCYVAINEGPGNTEKDGVFLLELVEAASESCMWKLANVRENRDPLAKGRPLSRKKKEWRLCLPFGSLKKVSLYIDNE